MPTLTVYIQPGAKVSRIVGLHDGLPKIAIQARPVEGEANAALIRFLADVTLSPQRSFRILSGQNSRIKRIDLPQAALEILQRMLQTT